MRISTDLIEQIGELLAKHLPSNGRSRLAFKPKRSNTGSETSAMPITIGCCVSQLMYQHSEYIDLIIDSR
jgi:hypothetical protein